MQLWAAQTGRRVSDELALLFKFILYFLFVEGALSRWKIKVAGVSVSDDAPGRDMFFCT